MMDHKRLRELAGIILETCPMGGEEEEVAANEKPASIAVRHEDSESTEEKELAALREELKQIDSELYNIFANLNGFIEKVSGKVKEEQLENEPEHVSMYRNLQRAAFEAANGIENTCRSLKLAVDVSNSSVPRPY